MSWTERTELLLGHEKLQRLRQAHVLIVGLGGVGAYAAEMLCRAGVGRMTIADADTVGESNINRQLIALHSTLGRPRPTCWAERLLDITPTSRSARWMASSRTRPPYPARQRRLRLCVDAIDTLSPKAHLIKGCLDRRIRVVSSMGAGAKTDPTRVEVADITHTHHCPLAHMLRKRLHKMGIHTGFYAVFSSERIREGAMIIDEQTNKKSNTGTISYMPAVFGCCCASVVVARPARRDGRAGQMMRHTDTKNINP